MSCISKEQKQKRRPGKAGTPMISENQLLRWGRYGLGLCQGRSLLWRQYTDVAAVLALVLKQHDAIDEREQRVVLAPAHIDAGLVARAPLTNQDRARVDHLAAETFHTQPLSLRVAAVYGGAAALLMCHNDFPSGAGFTCSPPKIGAG